MASSWNTPINGDAMLVTLVPSCNDVVFSKAIEFGVSRTYVAKAVENTHCNVGIAKAKVASMVEKVVDKSCARLRAIYEGHVFAIPVD